MIALFAVGAARPDSISRVDHAIGFGGGAELAAEIARRDGALLTLITSYGPEFAEYATFSPGDGGVDRCVAESRVLPTLLPPVTLGFLKGCEKLIVVQPVQLRRGAWRLKALVSEAIRTVPGAKLERYGIREGLSWKSGRK